MPEVGDMVGISISMDFGFPEKPLRKTHPLTGQTIMANTILCIRVDSTGQVLQELPFAEHLPESECRKIVEWYARQVQGGNIEGPSLRYTPPAPLVKPN